MSASQKALLLAVRPFAQTVADQTAKRLEGNLKRMASDLPSLLKSGGAIGRKPVADFAQLAADAVAAQSALAENLAGPKQPKRMGLGADLVSVTNTAEVKAKAKSVNLALIADGAQIINKSLERMSNGPAEWTEFQTRLLAFTEASIKLLAEDNAEGRAAD